MDVDKPIVFMFSGQGSQYYQMGRALYDGHPVFRHWMDTLDRSCLGIGGYSVTRELYDERQPAGKNFDRLEYTHPAIFMLEYALANVFMELGLHPQYVLGTSLGEYAACAVAGALDYETALASVIVQAEMIRTECEPGGMTAVLAPYTLYYDEPVFHTNTELASVNYDTHFVVAGGEAGLTAVEQYLKGREITFQRLPVPYGFHSRWIEAARMPYARHLGSVTLHSPRMKVVSGCMGVQENLDAESLWEAVREPLFFRSAIKALKPEKSKIYIDLGPSGTLANFMKQNRYLGLATEDIYPVITPFSKEMTGMERIVARIAAEQKGRPWY
ncbi:bacillaene synthase trans-acting acyltransferase [Paenibacillus mucilaginosus]|uniref:acyltransferase domain-containing protein n=1 Tax=Paenibacillus mucilaginosus TaxID=61624 RepID=UPI003D1C9B2A